MEQSHRDIASIATAKIANVLVKDFGAKGNTFAQNITFFKKQEPPRLPEHLLNKMYYINRISRDLLKSSDPNEKIPDLRGFNLNVEYILGSLADVLEEEKQAKQKQDAMTLKHEQAQEQKKKEQERKKQIKQQHLKRAQAQQRKNTPAMKMLLPAAALLSVAAFATWYQSNTEKSLAAEREKEMTLLQQELLQQQSQLNSSIQELSTLKEQLAPKPNDSAKLALPTTDSSKFEAEMLQLNTIKDEVTRIQLRLNQLGYDAGNPDGLKGVSTINAIRLFEVQNNLKADGILSPKEQELLFSDKAIRRA